MTLDPELEEMRRLGYRAVDRAVDFLAGLPGRRVITPPRAEILQPLLDEPLPADGLGIEDSVHRFCEEILPHATLVNHPRFFAYIPGPGSYAGALACWLEAVTNTFVGSWLGGSVMTQLEVQTLEWLRQAVGLPEGYTGIVTTGGSMANLIGLAAGLEGLERARATVYASEEAHYSVAKAARVLGVRPDHVRRVPVDRELRMAEPALVTLIANDRRAGLLPAVACATAGTTNTGSIDPLPAIADLCRRERLWLHVDAAYGGAVGLLAEGRRLLSGWERADSITLDPHKWLYVPFECGTLLTRHQDRLRAAFAGDAHYMQDIPRDQVNFWERGPELTRGNRALKLWMVLRAHGVRTLARFVQRDMELCRLAHELLAADPRIEILTPPRLSVFAFAPRAGDETGRRLLDAILADGYLMLSSTRIGGRFALRFCVANHRTSENDVRSSVRRILDLLGSLNAPA